MPPPIATNSTEIIRTTGDVQIMLSDSGPTISLETPVGTKVLLDASTINIRTAAGSIRIEGAAIIIEGAQIRLEAPLVSARVLRCDTLIADSVVAASYTPGAGNIW